MHLIGITSSLAAALLWALGIILFRKSQAGLSPMALNLFKCLVTLVLLLATAGIAGVDLTPQKSPATWGLFALSGFIGITLADSFFFMALSRIGAAMTAVVECIYLPLVILLSVVFLGEGLGIRGICGAGLVCAAIFVGSLSKQRLPISSGQLALGVLYGLLGIAFIAISIVMIKVELERSSVIWVALIRVFAGTLGLILLVGIHPGRKQIVAELKNTKTWITALPASVSGSYLAMLAWILGMKYTLVSVAAILNQLSTVFTFILAAIFLREPVTPARMTAVILAVCGAVLASVSV
jgi:drug/metabolite transporter (DMT)-like permease